MRFVCESCRAQYMINDDKVGPKGVKVRCRKCGYVILVKKTDGAGKAPAAAGSHAPVAMSNDPDDALATQVMQNPLDSPDHTASDSAGPGVSVEEKTQSIEAPKKKKKAEEKGANGQGDSFLGADEDEIGAVFDQVLKTGPTALPKDGEGKSGGQLEDDRQSTRVLDADMVRKLAEESGAAEAKAAAPEPKQEDVPLTDWYVAIDEKQTGPLTLEKVKEHWDKGEISADSLCWRNGFDDWIPLAAVKALASLLAPKPSKPIMVAAAPTVPASVTAPQVVSVPIQSAFSAGGVMQTVQSEMQVPISAAASSSVAEREESGTWKPSAASALASLVKDEMEALAKPPPPKKPEPAHEEVPSKGLLDLPQAAEEKPLNGHASAQAPAMDRAPMPAMERPRPVTNPYMQNPGATFSAPPMTQYRPPISRGLLFGIIGGIAFVLVLLVVLVVWLATRQPPQPLPQQPVVAQPTQPVAQPTQPAAQPTQPVAQPTQPVAVAQNPPPDKGEPKRTGTRPVKVATARPPVDDTPPPPKKERPEKVEKAEPKSSGDEFDEMFGDKKGGKKEAASSDSEPAPKKSNVYVPPAPGGAGVKESLGQSDIMEVVLANKSGLAKCAEEQRKKDPGTSGKLVMRWTIQTSGRPANVGVASEEFKGTYMAECVGKLIKSMSFPKHKVQGEPVQFPFKF